METELIMVAHVCTVAVCISTTITSIYKLESTKIRFEFEMLNLSTKSVSVHIAGIVLGI